MRKTVNVFHVPSDRNPCFVDPASRTFAARSLCADSHALCVPNPLCVAAAVKQRRHGLHPRAGFPAGVLPGGAQGNAEALACVADPVLSQHGKSSA